jgi:hypothetical protein
MSNNEAWKHDNSMLQRFERAVEALVVGTGNSTNKLILACKYLVPIFPRDVPNEFKHRFSDLKRDISSSNSNYDPVHISIAGMSWQKKRSWPSLFSRYTIT